MKVRTEDGSTDRLIVTAMAVNRRVLGAVAAKWEADLFPSRWTNLVGGWCVDFYRRYGRPPGRSLAVSFDRWAGAKKREADTVQRLEEFLTHLGDEYQRLKKKVQPDVIIDLAGEHFTRAKLRALHDGVDDLLNDGDVAAARALVEGFKPVEMGKGAWVDFFRDEEAVNRIFERKVEPLVTLPGAFGTFFAPALQRERLICFEGPTSVGKSWLLQEVGWQAMTQGRRVAFFQVGDLTQDQFGERLLVRAAGRPFSATAPNRPLLVPVDCLPQTVGPPEVKYREVRFKKPLDRKRAWAAARKVAEPWGDGDSLFRLACYPNDTVTIAHLWGVLDGWKADGWVPDVVVLDYADVLAPLDGRADTRDQINATWKKMKAMTQVFHCLVVTASQTDTDSYTAKVITKKNFSNDRRKNDHVDGMIGINQTDAEKQAGCYRLNWVKAREWEYSETQFLYTAGNLALGNPFMFASF